jgi:hypothetical protein
MKTIMNDYLATKLLSPRRTWLQSTPAPLKIVVVYQDEFCHALAQHMFYSTPQADVEQVKAVPLWCEFTALGQPSTYEKTLSAAAESDVIVIAIRADRPWPPIFGFWIESWLAQRQNARGALVAFLVNTTGSPSDPLFTGRYWELSDYFQEAAERASMDYFEQEYSSESGLRGAAQSAPAFGARQEHATRDSAN